MIIKKLSTEVSPPKLSIFWAESYKHDIYSEQQAKCINCGERINTEHKTVINSLGKAKKVKLASCGCDNPKFVEEEDKSVYDSFGASPNWVGAKRIIYKGQTLRIFPHEYSQISDEHLNFYILGMPGENIPSHELVSEIVPQNNEEGQPKSFLKEILDEAMKPIYDAALLDGATETQAKMLALGMDVTVPDASPIPLLGWYRCKKEFAEYFCTENEMTE